MVGDAVEGIFFTFHDSRAINADKSRKLRDSMQRIIEGKFGAHTRTATKQVTGKDTTHKAQVYYWELPNAFVEIDPISNISFGNGYRDQDVRYINFHGSITIFTSKGYSAIKRQQEEQKNAPLPVPF